MNVRFSMLLKSAMADSGIGGAKLEEILQERGVYNISRRRISEYITEVSTPGLEKAKLLMEALDYNIEEKDLSESLQLNRDLIREQREEQSMLRNSGYRRTVSVHIRVRNLVADGDPLDNERRLIERVSSLYGEYDVTRYVEELIAADLRLRTGKEV